MGLIWGTVLSVVGLVAAILIPAAGRLITDDAKEWLPWITRHLIERAVSRLPEGERERLEEEWWSHVNEWPGNLAKVYVAYGYLSASKSINRIVKSGKRLPLSVAIRRAIDIVVAAVCLALTVPIFVIAALCIKLESRGPAFYLQKRIGRDGRTFTIIKFRSMYIDRADGYRLTIKNDPRITRVGFFLRSTSIDELPQLFNVLFGDMSLLKRRPPKR